MDDFPAGPTCASARVPRLSVVIPVRNGGNDLERCLRALGFFARGDFEVIVVDDGSTDGSGERARGLGARVIRLDRSNGPAEARNVGVRAARGDLIFFVDADVAVHADAVGRVIERFDSRPGLAALFGSYDDQPAAPGVASRYRNLLHHYVHQQGEFTDDARPAHTFWTGCGAIRREVFLGLGGFDPKLYQRPAIEDIEFGYRLVRGGHRVELLRTLQATHLKRWSIPQIVRTDVFQRGVPWTLLMLRSGVVERDLNLRQSQRWSVVLTGMAGLGLLASPLVPAGLGVAAVSFAGIAALNWPFYRFLAGRGGWAFAVASMPLHAIYFGCCGGSVALAMGIWILQGRPVVRGAESGRRSDGPHQVPGPGASPHTLRGRLARWIRRVG
jgi:GT2 family glycosyltransferase